MSQSASNTNITTTNTKNNINNFNESIYYEIINIEPSNRKPAITDDALYLNQIVKEFDSEEASTQSERKFDQIQREDDDLMSSKITNRLSSLNSILQNSQKTASASHTDAMASTSNNISNNHSTIKQLSRNSSTFSSKSHYSMRSSMTKGTGGGGVGGMGNVGCAGSVSLSIATASHFKTNPSQHTNSNSKEQEIINQQNINNHPIDRYSIESTSNASIYSLNLNYANVKEPVIIRGAGNITIFGVCNKFNEQFPSQLNAKLAPEEFRDTIKQINNVLSKGTVCLIYLI